MRYMKKFKRNLIGLSFLLILPISSFSYEQEPPGQQQWVDSLMNTMSLRQRIAQLFLVSLSMEPKAKDNPDAVLDLVRKEHVGGIILMKGTPYAWVQTANRLQKAANIPLLMAIDAEFGLAMRMDSMPAFPRQMTLGALTDDKLIFEMGATVARQCKRIGLHMNFAPVVDINNNPGNPVINIRSFGESREKVADKAIVYMRGLQYNGILASAKHFPGHGDTDTDSHHLLPCLPYSAQRIDSLELYPFRKLIEAGVASVMVGHLEVPSLDTSSLPASLSPYIITSLLQDTLAFEGLVVTDALNMKGVLNGSKAEQIPLKALQAGNDLLLMPGKVPESITVIEKAVESGMIDEHAINMKCRKILGVKYRAGLQQQPLIDTTNLYADLNNFRDEALCNRIADAALTVVRNTDNILPVQRLEALNIAYVEVGKGKGTDFADALKLYADIASFSIDRMPSRKTLDSLTLSLKPFNLIIVGFHDADARPQYNFGVDSVLSAYLTNTAKEKNVVLAFFGTPYGIKKFNHYQNFQAIVIAYENRTFMMDRAAQLIFGGVPAQGVLPVSAADSLQAGDGITWNTATRLKYVLPEEIGIDSKRLYAMDTMMQHAVSAEATPGGQIVAAYQGRVFYRKSFGKHTYNAGARPVQNSDIYDLASLTKVNATLPVVMYLLQQKELKLKDELDDYLEFDKAAAGKRKLEIVDILTHQSGLRAFEPFHKRFLVKAERKGEIFEVLDTTLFRKTFSVKYALPVADHLFASVNVPILMNKEIDESDLLSKTYRYSDWGFMYMQRIVEKITGERLDRLANDLFYKPLGMNNTSFLPLNKFALERIPPSEVDVAYRRQTIQGYVNDHNAGFMGGVSGHAGLFANANDVAKLMQLYANKGIYGGQRYFDADLVDEFTACRFCEKNGNRRGLGFDKPEPDTHKNSPVERIMSLESYGHLGYTGTMCWVDPARDLIFVMLTNRTYPSDGKKLTTMNVRSRMLAEFAKVIDELRCKPDSE